MFRRKMSFTRYLWFLFMIQSPVLATTHYRFRISSHTSCLLKDNLVKSVAGLSLADCVDECVARTKCKALNYDTRLHLCGLFSDGTTYVGNTRGCTLVSKTDITIPQNIQDAGCNDGQNYNVRSQDCEYAECPTVKLLNGTIRGNMNDVGSRVQFTCDFLYYERRGLSDAICQDDGSWSYTPECVQFIEYIGCIQDGDNRALTDVHDMNDQMTLELCLSICTRYVYAMVESNDECFCGNELVHHKPIPESSCNNPCSGDSSQMCGGHWKGNLYKHIL